MAGRMYTVEFEAQTIAAASGDYDLFYIAPVDEKPVEIHAFSIDVTSELAEAQEEWLRLRMIRGHATVGSGGTAVAASAIGKSPGDVDASFTARTCDSAIATTGTLRNLWSGAMNVRSGCREIFTPEQREPLRCSQTEVSVLIRLMAAVADDVTMSGTLWVEELI